MRRCVAHKGPSRASVTYCNISCFIFFAPYIVVVSVVSVGLVCNFSIVATCPLIQLPALLFVCVFFLLFVDVLSGEPKQN